MVKQGPYFDFRILQNSDITRVCKFCVVSVKHISNNHWCVAMFTIVTQSLTGKPWWLCDVSNEAGGVTLFGDELDVNDDDAEGEGEGGGLGDSEMEGVWRPPSGGGVVSAESSPRISGVPELSRVRLDKTSSWLRSSELWEFRQRISSWKRKPWHVYLPWFTYSFCFEKTIQKLSV